MKIEEYYEPEDQKVIDGISNLIDHYREKFFSSTFSHEFELELNRTIAAERQIEYEYHTKPLVDRLMEFQTLTKKIRVIMTPEEFEKSEFNNEN